MLFQYFLWFVDALRKSDPPINGDFVNCFPLGEYFNSTGRNDIRFGRRKEIRNDGWDSEDQIAIFTRWQYEHRELWWDQVCRELWPTMKDRVLRWIANKSHDVTGGDIVTIFLIGHRDLEGINIAGQPLSPSDLAVACTKFPPEALINIILKAHLSGAFAKAFHVLGQLNLYVRASSKDEAGKSYPAKLSVSEPPRNSLFGADSVETLELIKDPDEIWTLGEQKKLEANLSGPLVPGSKISYPQVVSDSTTKRLMRDIMRRGYLDVTFDRVPTSAQPVLSSSNDALRKLAISNSQPRPASPMQSYNAAEIILNEEMGLVDTDYLDSVDAGVTEMYFSLNRMPKSRRTSAIKDLLAVLCYRFHLQERVFIVAESLMALGRLSYGAIYAPMNLS